MIVNRYPPYVGGVEFHVRNLATALAEQGHELWVLTIAEKAGERIDEGPVRVLTGTAHAPIAEIITFPAPGATRRIAEFLREHSIDAVSVHTRFFPMSFVGVRAARRAGIPVIHTEHGSDFVASDSPIVSIGSRIVDFTMGRYVLKSADRVVAVSPEAAAFASRLGGVRASVFYNAITPPAYDAPPVQRPSSLVFVGRLVPGKGWDVFIGAIEALRDRGVEVTGELLGAGPDLEAARQAVREKGLEAVVAVRGRVSPDEVREALAGATLVNPTVLSEGFQTTLLEALAERGRVVTFDVPGAELLRDRGFPVSICADRTEDRLVESLVEFLEDPPALADPSLIDEWTWTNRAEEYARIASDVVAEHSSPSE